MTVVIYENKLWWKILKANYLPLASFGFSIQNAYVPPIDVCYVVYIWQNFRWQNQTLHYNETTYLCIKLFAWFCVFTAI